MSVGDRILELRNERDLSQKKLADAVGLSQAAIAKIEVNRNEATSETLRKLAIFFHVSADYLLELEDDFGTKVTSPSLSSDSENYSTEEKQIIEMYRGLNLSCKKLIRDNINMLTTTTAASNRKKGEI